MKLIIQIPCLNEAEVLPATLAALPRRVEGFDSVEFLVVDDGSTDATAETARRHGADHVVRLNTHRGLARAFMAGLEAALMRGADVIVNVDADNQYQAADIPALTAPILSGVADLVIGARPVGVLAHFSRTKRLLQRVGTGVVRAMTGLDVRDAPSGFRALTRETALRLNVFSEFTYTIETIIQAAVFNLRVVSVPVRVNGPTRPSRLFRSNSFYLGRSAATILHVYLIYCPARLFGLAALLFFLPALVLGLRYFTLMAEGEGKGHIHSLIACGTLTLSGAIALAGGALASLLRVNRRLLEELQYLARVQRTRGYGFPREENGNGAAAHLLSEKRVSASR